MCVAKVSPFAFRGLRKAKVITVAYGLGGPYEAMLAAYTQAAHMHALYKERHTDHPSIGTLVSM